MIRLTEIIDEESEAAKQAKAQGLEYLSFGRYGKDGKVTHTVQNGKLVPISPAANPVVSKNKTAPKAQSGLDLDKFADDDAMTAYDQGGYYDSHISSTQKDRGVTAKPARIVQIIDDKIEAALGNKIAKYIDKQMSIDDFSKLTGLTPKQLMAYDKFADDYERTFSIDGNNVWVHNPMDI